MLAKISQRHGDGFGDLRETDMPCRQLGHAQRIFITYFIGRRPQTSVLFYKSEETHPNIAKYNPMGPLHASDSRNDNGTRFHNILWEFQQTHYST